MNARIIFEVKKSCLTLLKFNQNLNVAKSSCSRVVNLEIIKKSFLKILILKQFYGKTFTPRSHFEKQIILIKKSVAKSITGLEKKIEKEDEVFDSFGYEAKCPW